MKISDVRTFVVGNPWKNWVFIKVYTDEGIVGLGEATGGLSTKPHIADVEELTRHVIGADPMHPDRLWNELYRTRFLHGSVAMSGLEIACWDIAGKALGLPVWQLLGGKHRDSLRVYANGWYKGPREPGFMAEAALSMVEKGYTALKFDPFGAAYRTIDSESASLSIGIVQAVRDAVGPGVDILIEGHDRFNLTTAVGIGRKLADLGVLFFETPVNSLDIPGTAAASSAMPVPVAVGERFTELRQFSEILSTRTISIVQPEPMNLGLSNTKKACGIAESYDAMVACHQAQSPFCTAVNAHLHASIPNFLIHENFDDSLEPWTWDLLSGCPRVRDGWIDVPNSPGFGVELNEDEVLRHPYSEKNFLRLFEEGWERRESK
ncbi:MAG: mandelate racemase/muconate lactonizing enzyme family protein [Spirochaetales bacterium]|nr:MAG: mandelate racemase/muconate lactonizing enzyme family protein [Spirochaetales bacterium]